MFGLNKRKRYRYGEGKCTVDPALQLSTTPRRRIEGVEV
jgi:hypothetical protein